MGTALAAVAYLFAQNGLWWEYNVIAAPNNIAAITSATTLAVNHILAWSELKIPDAPGGTAPVVPPAC